MTDPGPRPAPPGWSKLLQEQRLSRGYSARKAASIAGVSDSFWGMCERGVVPVKGKPARPLQPSRKVLLQMCQALRSSAAMTNAILTSAGHRPVPASGEPPDPSAEVDLRGLTTGDINMVSAVARHLRDIRRTTTPHVVRGENPYEQGNPDGQD